MTQINPSKRTMELPSIIIRDIIDRLKNCFFQLLLGFGLTNHVSINAIQKGTAMYKSALWSNR